MGGGTGSHPPPAIPEQVDPAHTDEGIPTEETAPNPASRRNVVDVRPPDQTGLYVLVGVSVAAIVVYVVLVAVFGY